MTASASVSPDFPSTRNSDLSRLLEQSRQASLLREQAEQALILQNEKIEQELLLAAELQQAVLPASIDLDYLEISKLYKPYSEVSGDVYDFLQNREGELAVFLGDATGHGIAAALMTMMIHIGLDGLRRNLPTDESLSKLNKLLALRQTGRSVSAVFFRVTPGGVLTVTHAGHPSLIVIPADAAKPPACFDKGGCALGLFEDEPVPYEEESYCLRKGDKLVAYTDAATEWANEKREPFGEERLLSLLSEHRSDELGSLRSRIWQALTAHSGGQKCHDDLTMLLLEYRGDGH